MPRPLRSNRIEVPQHVIQRGNNRMACFHAPVDYQRYLIYLRDASQRFECAVHAYVLMTNHVHLLVTPTRPGAVSRTMQMLGANYVRYVNRTRRRTGTLWEGRPKVRLIDSDEYLLKCYRYIEQNPFRARIVDDVADYPWSSYGFNAEGRFDPLLAPHPLYLSLGTCQASRLSAYRGLVRSPLSDADLEAIRAQRGQRHL